MFFSYFWFLNHNYKLMLLSKTSSPISQTITLSKNLKESKKLFNNKTDFTKHRPIKIMKPWLWSSIFNHPFGIVTSSFIHVFQSVNLHNQHKKISYLQKKIVCYIICGPMKSQLCNVTSFVTQHNRYFVVLKFIQYNEIIISLYSNLCNTTKL